MLPLLTLIGGLACTSAYAASIRIGFRDKNFRRS
jgi:hypothetical protein